MSPARRQHRRPADPGRLAYAFLRGEPVLCASIARRAYGRRLDIPAGTALRFEPGEGREVDLVPLRRSPDRLRHERAGQRPARRRRDGALSGREPRIHRRTRVKIARRTYADLYGPTAGDRVRLGDTACSSRSRRTSRATAKRSSFGGGKVIRDGQGQSQATRAVGRSRPRHHQRHRPRPLGHRQSRRRRPRRPHLRPSARPAIRTSRTASRRGWRSGRRPKSSPANIAS